MNELSGQEFFDHRCPPDLTGKGEEQSQHMAHLVLSIQEETEGKLWDYFMESPMEARGQELLDILIALGCERLMDILLDRTCHHGITRRDCGVCYDDLFDQHISKGNIE